MVLNVMSMSITIWHIYCHFNTRTPVPTKLGQGKVEKSSCTSAASDVYDYPTVTARYY